MRLPGTRYQEHGWEQVRKLLGQCSLQACAAGLPLRLAACGGVSGNDAASIELAECLCDYVEAMAHALRQGARGARATMDGNSYGDSVLELAMGLLAELQARPAEWAAFGAAVAAEHARLGPFWRRDGGDAILRKKVNDMYAVLRDKVDADNYVAACGRPCSANRMYAYRMLDMAYADIARLFDAWREAPEQVAAIVGRAGASMSVSAPIEVRQLRSIGACRAEWIIAWSASREQFTGAPGPLHTRSKRFASLKHHPDKIAAMLREIGDYEELSAQRDSSWQQDTLDATDWLDDLARVLDLPDAVCGDDNPGAISVSPRLHDAAPAGDEDARAAAGWAGRALDGCSLPVRLAVYLKLMGPTDDSYPLEWLDAATGELPTMQQLAARDGVSLPTLRKRRDAAIASLQATLAAPSEPERPAPLEMPAMIAPTLFVPASAGFTDARRAQ